MKLVIGSDHRGFKLKNKLLKMFKKENIVCEDFGTYQADSVDYPFYAIKVAEAVSKKEYDFGVVICGSGIGVSISANKVKGIRAALVRNKEDAKLSREHNDANIIALGSKTTPRKAIEMIKVFISSEFSHGRHKLRVDLIKEYEKVD